MRPAVLARLALTGNRTDRLRMILTAITCALITTALLIAATLEYVGQFGWWGHKVFILALPMRFAPSYLQIMLFGVGSPRTSAELTPSFVEIPLMAIPLLGALFGQCIRFGAPVRDRRLAGLRLAGATPRQTALITATETVIAALAGSLAGLGGYAFLMHQALYSDIWVVREPSPFLPGWHMRPTATELLPPGRLAAILILVPALAGLANLLLLRRVTSTPLGVYRHSPHRRPSPLPGLLILSVVALPFLLPPLRHWVEQRLLYSSVIEVLAGPVSATALAILGVVLATSWISYCAGFLLHRYSRRPAMLLAGRHLMANPWNGSRSLAMLLAALVLGAVAYNARAKWVTAFHASQQIDPKFRPKFLPTLSIQDYTGDVDTITKAALIPAVLGILIALADNTLARRRTLATLTATGVPHRVLGETIAWQTLTPLLPASLIALTTGTALFRITGTTASATASASIPGGTWRDLTVTLPVPIPYNALTLLGSAALLTAATATTISWLLLRHTTDGPRRPAGETITSVSVFVLVAVVALGIVLDRRHHEEIPNATSPASATPAVPVDTTTVKPRLDETTANPRPGQSGRSTSRVAMTGAYTNPGAAP